MNKVILLGRLTRNPEVRYSQGENASVIARFTLAVDRRVRTQGGDNADFISCISFGKTAEFAEKYLKQGVKVAAVGRIQTGSYTKDAKKVYTTDVVVEELEFAESKHSSGDAETSATGRGAHTESPEGFMNIPDGLDEEMPFH